MDIGTAIKRERKRLGLTQRQLADYAGCTHVLIINLEKGNTKVTFAKLLEILKVLGLEFVLERGKRVMRVGDSLK